MSETSKTSKETLRQEALRHRVLMDPRSENPDDACDIFFENCKPEKDSVVAVYWPKDKEFALHAIIERLGAENITCLLPVMQKETRVLKFARWRDGDPLEKGPYGVEQPVITDQTEWLDPDIVLVPLLAFDRRGYRLGYGGGFYDATLAALRDKKTIQAVGLAYAQQATLFNLPAEEHDQRLDWVITPKEAHSFA